MSALAAEQHPDPGRRLGLPRRSIRLRLTVLYGSLFLLSGIALLAITYVLVGAGIRQRPVHEGGQRLGRLHRLLAGLRLLVAGGTDAAIGHGEWRSVGRSRSGARESRRLAAASRRIVPGTPTQELISGRLGAVARGPGTAVVQSGVALAIMALISVWLGWLVAGRALRPLRTITDAAREISAHDLHRRLALDGPDDEFRRLGKTFDGLLERLEGSFEAQRRFVANASHELRTPLTLQRALVQVALADPERRPRRLPRDGRRGARHRRTPGTADRGTPHALPEPERLDRREPIDLAALTAEAVQPLAEDGLTLESSLERARTTGDPYLVERLLANLIGNAVEHNLPGGRIEVATRTVAGRAILTVANSGREIPAAEIGRLFQPFQRLQAERTSGGNGAGLGLSIVEAIATAHEATLSARPRAGGGLEIEIGFPAEAGSAAPA